ncbi:hypothetical protein ACIPLC_22175 [Kitasatospora sp. NPDC086801]|uniref:hypothetical protein n=1 Tax=Kitasatospora sp. NPDC086801 TaxID=3364066 RepID=UPI0037F511CE
MNNLDFSAEPLFSWYVVALAISGAAMLVLGAVNPGGGLKVGWRILNVLAGLGFLGYAYYLMFVFEGGQYEIRFKAFILPIALIANSVKAIVERGNAKNQQPPAPTAPYDPAAGYPQGVPPQAAPYNPNAPQSPYGQPVPPQAAPYAPQGAAPYQQGVPAPQAAPYAPPAQAVPNNPYAQPVPPAAQPGQPQ